MSPADLALVPIYAALTGIGLLILCWTLLNGRCSCAGARKRRHPSGEGLIHSEAGYSSLLPPTAFGRLKQRVVSFCARLGALAAIYSDNVIRALYPSRLFLEDGKVTVEADGAAEKSFEWLSFKSWYLAAGRW